MLTRCFVSRTPFDHRDSLVDFKSFIFFLLYLIDFVLHDGKMTDCYEVSNVKRSLSWGVMECTMIHQV